MAGDDPVRELNSFLQLTSVPHLLFSNVQEGPNHQPTHTGTYTFRGVVVGTGTATAKYMAKRQAATQALQYFSRHGIPE